MKNPWEKICLEDYENHMRSETVMQMQAMSSMMKGQFQQYPVETIMILGIAGGNGLEHIHASSVKKVYGIDINQKYLLECIKRFPELHEVFVPIHIDLMHDLLSLPAADIIVANLLIEYIGCDCFQRVIRQVRPLYVSCGIQINQDSGFVSDSSYAHVFDALGSVHHQIDQPALVHTMGEIGYSLILEEESPLPNEKSLLRLDFMQT